MVNSRFFPISKYMKLIYCFITGEIQQTGRMKFKVTSVLNKASESVGYLHGKRKTGTCWRVGIDKIITAFHVVRDNICKLCMR